MGGMFSSVGEYAGIHAARIVSEPLNKGIDVADRRAGEAIGVARDAVKAGDKHAGNLIAAVDKTANRGIDVIDVRSGQVINSVDRLVAVVDERADQGIRSFNAFSVNKMQLQENAMGYLGTSVVITAAVWCFTTHSRRSKQLAIRGGAASIATLGAWWLLRPPPVRYHTLENSLNIPPPPSDARFH